MFDAESRIDQLASRIESTTRAGITEIGGRRVPVRSGGDGGPQVRSSGVGRNPLAVSRGPTTPPPPTCSSPSPTTVGGNPRQYDEVGRELEETRELLEDQQREARGDGEYEGSGAGRGGDRAPQEIEEQACTTSPSEGYRRAAPPARGPDRGRRRGRAPEAGCSRVVERSTGDAPARSCNRVRLPPQTRRPVQTHLPLRTAGGCRHRRRPPGATGDGMRVRWGFDRVRRHLGAPRSGGRRHQAST